MKWDVGSWKWDVRRGKLFIENRSGKFAVWSLIVCHVLQGVEEIKMRIRLYQKNIRWKHLTALQNQTDTFFLLFEICEVSFTSDFSEECFAL